MVFARTIQPTTVLATTIVQVPIQADRTILHLTTASLTQAGNIIARERIIKDRITVPELTRGITPLAVPPGTTLTSVQIIQAITTHILGQAITAAEVIAAHALAVLATQETIVATQDQVTRATLTAIHVQVLAAALTHIADQALVLQVTIVTQDQVLHLQVAQAIRVQVQVAAHVQAQAALVQVALQAAALVLHQEAQAQEADKTALLNMN